MTDGSNPESVAEGSSPESVAEGSAPEYVTDGSTPEYGEAWAYESIVGALPGVDLSTRAAVAVQLVGFEAAVLALSWYYGLPRVAVAGTVAVLVATTGSAAMLLMGERVRAADVPPAYPRLLFGSSMDVVLGLLAFVALVVYLFVVDPRDGATLLGDVVGPDPPALAVYVGLVVAWDVCYRIGTGWWASVVGVWRSWRYDLDAETVDRLRTVDAVNVGFALVQLALVPLLAGHPVLQVAVLGHVAAVALVAGLSRSLLR